jgi:NADPH-dependent 2,4-dienoyl-CoA reductase/sulfur reductase-like enzyme
MIWNEPQACWHCIRDEWGATTIERVAVAGDCAAIMGAVVAEHQGRLAGLDAAHRLGKLKRGERDQAGARSLAALAKLTGLRQFLDVLYRPRAEILAPSDDETVVCRCEEVTAGELRRVAEQGGFGPNQAKAFTRAGMGPCQGRMCGLPVAAVLAQATETSPAEIGHYRVRPPIKPISIDQLADLDGVGDEVAALDAMPTGDTKGP